MMLFQTIHSFYSFVREASNSQDNWIQLHQSLSEYAFDEAKLLCEEAPNTWVAWVPDYGEVILFDLLSALEEECS